MVAGYRKGYSRIVNINKKVQNLRISKKYFFSIKKKNHTKYWFKRKDPDGNLRDRILNFETEKNFFKKNNQSLIKIINGLYPKSILDIGCGPGFLLSILKKKIKKLVGVEVDAAAAKKAEEFANIYVCDLNKQFNFDGKFELVIAYHVIEHLKNPILFIKKVKKLISSGGHLIIGTPDFDSSMSRLFKNNYRMLHDKTHISLFSTESITRLLVDNKFLVEKIDYPFFDTTYFTKKNLLRMFDRNKISPPFYGNLMTIVAKKI